MTIERLAPTLQPAQGDGARVVCFTATSSTISRIARIVRIGRDADGRLAGFQRPQIASHIREIRDFLAKPDAVLPNAIVLALPEAAVQMDGDALCVDVGAGAPGWVVDGQQRLCAALGLEDDGFEFVVSALICGDLAELNRQFILINNTRPLPKPLIYELLPGTAGLPDRLSERAGAALLVERLNYTASSSLAGLIHQQTNPDGVIRDTLMQRMLINSIKEGMLRGMNTAELMTDGVELVSTFFAAVRRTFHDDWEGRTPKTSRLLHGTGIIAMGYVMDEIAGRTRATTVEDFERGLAPLRGLTHWAEGTWDFGVERRAWNGLQNTTADYRLLSHHLVRIIRRAGRRLGAVA